MRSRSFAIGSLGIICVLAVLSLAFIGINGAFEQNVAEAADIYSLINDGVVRVYEREIAGERGLSLMTAKQLEKLSEGLNVSVGKFKAAYLICDLAGRVGESAEITQVAKMKDMELIGFAHRLADKYLASVGEERGKQLKEMFVKELDLGSALIGSLI